MKKLFALCLVLLTSALCPLLASAQAPQLINYQGRLLSGTNLVNGNVELSLRLFDADSLGNLIYEDSNTVTVTDGLYSTFIGDNPTNAAFLSALTNAGVWIEVSVNGVALSPRERLTSVGYSLATRGISVNSNNNIFVLNPAENTVDLTADHSTIAGGHQNRIQTNAYYSFLGGGSDNSILLDAQHSFLGSGDQNSIQQFAGNSFLGGGYNNSIQLFCTHSFLGGGEGNSIQTNNLHSFLGGGYYNIIQPNSTYSFLGGGYNNVIQPNSTYSFLGGGYYNAIKANSPYSFIGGGVYNSVIGQYGVVLGGSFNSAGTRSFAAGSFALATNQGSFVWADSQFQYFGTSATNQFLIRASGGVGIGTATPANQLSVAGQADFSGRVGIGTVTPGQNLTIATKTFDTNATAKLGLLAFGGHLWILQSVSAYDTNATVTSGTPSGSLQFIDPSTGITAMTLTPNGRVGIGKTAPVSALDVAGTVTANGFSGNGAALTNVTGAGIADGSISNADLSASVLTNISGRADSNLVWSTFAAVTGLTAEANSRIGGDAALSNAVASLETNISARADSNLVWSTFAAVTGLTAEANSRIGGDAALSNSVALKLDSNVWAAANSTTNFVRRTGDTMTGSLTVLGTVNATAFTGDGSGLTGIAGATLANGSVSNVHLATEVLTNISARLASNVWAAADAARIASDAALSNRVASLDTNVAARLASNVWAVANSTTNHTRRTGDTMTGTLNLPAGGLVVGTSQLVVTAAGNVGIGVTAPATRLHLKQIQDNSGFGANNDGLRIEAASGEYWGLQTQSGGDLVFDSGLGTAYSYISRNGGTFNTTSDSRFKKDVEPLAGTLDRVLQLRPVTFRYNGAPEDSKPVTGFIAQEVLPLFPDVVDEKDGHYAINYGGFGPIAIGAIQELKKESDAKIEVLEKQNAEQTKLLLELRARLDALENK